MEDIGFEEQILLETQEREREAKKRTRVDEDGMESEWDEDKQAWFPRIDEDFIARYQMNYGANPLDTSSVPSSTDPAVASTEDPSIPPTVDVNSPEYYKWYYSYYYNYSEDSMAAIEPDSTAPVLSSEVSELESNLNQNNTPLATETNTPPSETLPPDDSTALDPEQQQYDEYFLSYSDWASYDQSESSEVEAAGTKSEQTGQVDQSDEVSSATPSAGKDKAKKRPNQQQGWFEVDETKNTNIYISGLPSETSDEDFRELMNKCGLIQYDPKTNKPKLKLYRNDNGEVKGDGRCCYIKPESVQLALQILDGSNFKGNTIHVEQAKFELKGKFDPKRRRKLTNREKKAMKAKVEKLFDWRPDLPRGARMKFERVVVLKNVFDPAMFDKNPLFINELSEKLRMEGTKYGSVTKVTVCEKHEEKVATMRFKEAEEADICIEAMNGRLFMGRQITAQRWDGKIKYENKETAEEEEARLKKWAEFLESEKEAEIKKQSEKSDEAKLEHLPLEGVRVEQGDSSVKDLPSEGDSVEHEESNVQESPLEGISVEPDKENHMDDETMQDPDGAGASGME